MKKLWVVIRNFMAGIIHSPWKVSLLCGVFLLAGVTGHDPWKPDDAVNIGIIWAGFQYGSWFPPHVGALTVQSIFSPFYNILAAGLAALLSPIIPFHDGVRLLNVLLGALFFFFLTKAAQLILERTSRQSEIISISSGWQLGQAPQTSILIAPLLAIGTVGLVIPLHDTQPAIATLAASGLIYIGLLHSIGELRILHSALLLGLGAGASFILAGLEAFLYSLTLIFIPIIRGKWRITLAAVLVAFMVAIPFVLLQNSQREVQQAWEIYFQRIDKMSLLVSKAHFEILSWFVWPLWPLAIWSIWTNRKYLSAPHILYMLICLMLAFLWFIFGKSQPIRALPLIPPLILLSVIGVNRLPRGPNNAFDWFGKVTFTLMHVVLWVGAIGLFTNTPMFVAKNLEKLQPGFVAPWDSHIRIAIAAFCSLVWIIILFTIPRSHWRAIVRWSLGLLSTWLIIVVLWFPWIDYGKTFRPVVASIVKELPQDYGCIADKDLSIAVRGMLDYFAGIRSIPLEASGDRCRWLIAEGDLSANIKPQWVKVWEGQRIGNKDEHIFLFKKVP